MILGVVATFMVVTSPKVVSTSSVADVKRDLFSQWKLSNGKSYSVNAEEEHRFQVWSENFDFVQEHNKIATNTYTVGMNVFADLTVQEFSASFGKCVNGATPNASGDTTSNASAPTTVDWRTKGAVTPVKNQQQCGSCWAFSTTGSLEGLHAISTGSLLSFSEQQLVDCSDSYGNQGCNGGLMDDAFEYVAAKGVELESTYPYTAEDGSCAYKSASTVFKNAGHTDVPANNNNALAVAVASHPVSIGIEADSSAFQLYNGGVFNDASCGTTIDHGVLIVGYGTASSQDYWIVKNSWGASWGESGYIRMEKVSGSSAGMCGLAQTASYPTGTGQTGKGGNEGEESKEESSENKESTEQTESN
jgi:cathepsin L